MSHRYETLDLPGKDAPVEDVPQEVPTVQRTERQSAAPHQLNRRTFVKAAAATIAAASIASPLYAQGTAGGWGHRLWPWRTARGLSQQ